MGAWAVQSDAGGEWIVTVQPAHKRFDAALVVRDGLRAALPESEIQLGKDATYAPDDLVTVVQVSSVRPIGALPGQRWGFTVNVSLVTTGPDFDATADEADRVADAMLSMTDVDEVKVSSVTCDSEPVRLSPHSPSGAETISSSYSAILRRKGRA